MKTENRSDKVVVGDGKLVDSSQVAVMNRDVPVTNVDSMTEEDLMKAVLDAGANTAGGCSPTSK